MNKETTCCFTGPRPPRLPMNGNEYSAEIAGLKAAIRAAVIDAYEEGFRFFISGMAEGFDLFAAEAVLELKSSFGDIALVSALPYSDVFKHHSPEISKRIESVLEKSDIVVSLSEKYIPGCEHLRNKYMVDNSSRIISYYNGLSGGTAHCWNYAVENCLETVNLYESI